MVQWGLEDGKEGTYTLNEKSRGFWDEVPYDKLKLNSNLFSTHGNGALFKINGKITYMRLSHQSSVAYESDR